MQTQWITLHDIPANGREFSFHDQDIWEGLVTDCHLPCRAEQPVRVTFTALPGRDGIFFQGTLTGTVILQCSRCLEDARIVFNEPFDFFEPLEAGDTASRASLVREKNGIVAFDVIGLAWEQFIMALPDKPLCSAKCRGICPVCGQNLNAASCTCHTGSGDPRLSVLRNLTLTKN